VITDVDLVAPPARISSWLRDAGLEPGDDLVVEALSGGSSNLTFRVRDGRHDWVLRRPPASGALPTAHDVLREFRIQRALAPTDVPVPVMVAACDDPGVIGAPFYVMDHVDGVVYTKPHQLAALDAPSAHAVGMSLADTLAALHAIDPAEIGLGDLVRPEPFVDRQLRRWQQQWERSRTAPVPLLDAVFARLTSTRPPAPPARLVHGDFNLGNVMFAVSEVSTVAAVLDWELTAAGDPLADLGALLAYWGAAGQLLSARRGGHLPDANAGLPTGPELIARYAAATGDPADGLSFYIALATAKLAVICAGSLLRATDQSDAHRSTLTALVNALAEVAADELGIGSAGAGLYATIRRRRDVRGQFTGEAVDDEAMRRVLAAAHAAPSVGLSQPWDFIVVRSEDTRRAFWEHVQEERAVFAASLSGERADRFAGIKIDGVMESGQAVVVTYDRRRGEPAVLGRHAIADAGLYSVCLAIENLWLAATAEQWGVGWVSFYREEFLRRLLGIPEGVRPVAWLCVGPVSRLESVPDLERHAWRERRPLEAALHFERWSRVEDDPVAVDPGTGQSEAGRQELHRVGEGDSAG
jgi:5,6-dimethylbenzimidazole synthase